MARNRSALGSVLAPGASKRDNMVIQSHTLLGRLLIMHAGIKVKPCQWKEAQGLFYLQKQATPAFNLW